jgi:hypothetical protein
VLCTANFSLDDDDDDDDDNGGGGCEDEDDGVYLNKYYNEGCYKICSICIRIIYRLRLR